MVCVACKLIEDENIGQLFLEGVVSGGRTSGEGLDGEERGRIEADGGCNVGPSVIELRLRAKRTSSLAGCGSSPSDAASASQ